MPTPTSLTSAAVAFRAELGALLDSRAAEVIAFSARAETMRLKLSAMDPRGPDRSDVAGALSNLDIVDGLLNALDHDSSLVGAQR